MKIGKSQGHVLGNTNLEVQVKGEWICGKIQRGSQGEKDKQWQMLQSDFGPWSRVPGMVKGGARLQWAEDRIRDEMVRVGGRWWKNWVSWVSSKMFKWRWQVKFVCGWSETQEVEGKMELRVQAIWPQSLGKPPLLWFRGGWSRHRGKQWRTSCLRPLLFAVEQVMLLADKREKVMGGFPKRTH